VRGKHVHITHDRRRLRAGGCRVLIVYKPLAPGEADKAPARRRKKTASGTAKPKSSTAAAAKEKTSLNAKSE
jgi:hypothetical protein